jgi:hypothetical protein
LSKAVLIVVGVVIAILGILALFPNVIMGMWLSIVLIVLGIISIIIGFLDKGRAVIKEEKVKDIKQEEQVENKI